jgi:DNA-3-methyladenine glycosylase II
VADTPFDRLKNIGLSGSKTNYIRNVAAFDLSSGLSFQHLQQMSDEETIAYLTQIKGVGRWTAEMLLMFALEREDVFSTDDLGIQNAMIRLYNLKAPDKKSLRQQLKRVSDRWRPYRTFACLYLWQWHDGNK